MFITCALLVTLPQGGPLGAFPSNTKDPSIEILEGDTPIGKERGALGVGMPTPKKEEEEEMPEEVREMQEEGFCTDCANLPCLCTLLRLKLKLSLMKRDRKEEDEMTKSRSRKRRELGSRAPNLREGVMLPNLNKNGWDNSSISK